MAVVKWGFGMAPFKKETEYTYRKALCQTVNYIYDFPIPSGITITDEISVVKGMFNRIIRQDQWDWFTVNMYFDYPSEDTCRKLINALTILRKSIIADDTQAIERTKAVLKNLNYQYYFNSYAEFNDKDNKQEYIYILSRREEKELLKIGMTTRNVVQRCKEINSATGVVFPFSPRRVYKVVDAVKAERLIHEALGEWRVRDDREFFIIPYRDACAIIETVIKENNLFYI